MKVVIVTWQAGGATQPAIGLGRLLTEHGHRVRIVAPTRYAARIDAAGCAHRIFPRRLEFDAARGWAAEDQEQYMFSTFFGRTLPATLHAEHEAEPANVVVVDFLLRSTACLAERLPVASVLMLHMAHRIHGTLPDADEDSEEAWGWRWSHRQVNMLRSEFGLPPLPIGPDLSAIALARRAAGALVVMPTEFDPWPPDAPANVVHVGPIFEEGTQEEWDPPWVQGDERPLVVVSMGSMYMHQEEVLQRVASALAELDVRALVLTGHELEPGELDFGPGVHVRDYVPTARCCPAQRSSSPIFAGMGTLMAAFAAGVPALCIPLGRDQVENAERVGELGAGTMLTPEAGPDELREAIAAALADTSLRAGARRMAAAVASYGNGEMAVDEIARAHARWAAAR